MPFAGGVWAMTAEFDRRQALFENDAVPTPALPSSFRDPSGFLFRGPDGELLRQINHHYVDDYHRLIQSSLCDQLFRDELLIEHEEVSVDLRATDDAAYVIRPRELPFISYPYEWCFSALQDAALLTLELQQRAMTVGLSLKDASAYNVQFDGCRPVFIDTLSFERYEPGRPWTSYGQFCQHFLAPLALMAKTHIGLNRLLALHLDGVPLDLATRLLPLKSRWNPGLLMHIHLHARAVRKHRCTSIDATLDNSLRLTQMSPRALATLVDSLSRTIRSLSWSPQGTEWFDYYQEHSYCPEAFEEKRRTVSRFLDCIEPKMVWDLGANTGTFCRLAREQGAATIAFDLDPACVERHYLACRGDRDRRVLPLLLDLTNPSPAIGWGNEERSSIVERTPNDTVMALALIHHLAIANNLPLARIAQFLSKLCRWLIIEFVPKEDPQARRLLQSRRDIFDDYNQEGFEAALARYFLIDERVPVGEDGRVLYLMEKHNAF